jgi:lipopolysaccharide export system protein LptA
VQKIHFLLLFILIPFTLLGQKRTKITLVNSQHSTVDLKSNISYLRKPVFKQDNAILSCDSAVFFEARNVFEAYNNVHINQADTVNIYSDRLTYDGNTKMAHLSSNVRLLDRTSVLTTNILDYNMGTKVGTYVEGGKIVSKDVTVTSKNGYYFANSRDSYFRYNVLVVSPEVKILSDTMRYNTLTNWTFFYGPTNIKGQDDNLYTENGAYNTKSEYAYFGRKNLYTQGSKSLKGDSLYYDGKAGYGKAVRNIIFSDTSDRTVLYGQLGYYYKVDQRAVVTKNAYVGMGKDSVKIENVLRPDTLWLGADTLETQMVLRQTLNLIPRPVIKKDNEIGSDAAEPGADTKSGKKKKNAGASPAATVPDDPKEPAANKKFKRDKSKNEVAGGKEQVDSLAQTALPKDSLQKGANERLRPNVKDSLQQGAKDSLQRLAKRPDSVVKSLKGPIDSLKQVVRKTTDSVKAKVSGPAAKVTGAVKTKVTDSLKAKATDSVKAKAALKPARIINPLDTVKARTIKAYHNVKVYKSNLQAKSDSLFYNSADSTLRWFNNPIMWGDGSQQTGDTIYLQMRNSKLSSVQVLQTAFSVNVEKDSLRFNQVKGKVMTGFFKDGKINSLYVDGNAESVYYTKDEAKDIYKEMNQTVSSRLKITFKNDEIADLVTIKDAESAITPVGKLKEDVFLTGFIWKPELRPQSKRDITNPKAIKAVKASKKGTTAAKGKPTDEKGTAKASANASAKAADARTAGGLSSDSTQTESPAVKSLGKSVPGVKPTGPSAPGTKPIAPSTTETKAVPAAIPVKDVKVTPSRPLAAPQKQ